MFGLTIAIGGVCGLVAVAFHAAIRFVESQTIERAFDAPGSTGLAWVIAVPTLGALVAAILLHYVVPGARGSGIPQVKVAYTLKGRTLRLRDTIGKFVVGSIQIGTGSSLGREGPSVQVCSGVASVLGRLAGVAPQRLKLLLPVGAAAGVAAAFNAPIAAVTFAIEEIVGTLDQTLLSGVIVAAALAAVVERTVLGEHPVLEIPAGYSMEHASSLLFYAALGVAAALVSVAFTQSLLAVRRWFAKATRLPGWLKPAFGGLATGLLAVAALLWLNSGGITGGGYGALEDALSGQLVVRTLLGLCALKFAATVLSYASGGAGGIFAPSLFIGGMLGGAFGFLDVKIFGHTHTQVGAFALVGMGAVFAGIVRAPITSVLIIIEMTGGYSLALPLMIANMMSYGLARQLRPRPIYEALLEQDGVELHPKPDADRSDGLTLESVPLNAGHYVSFTHRVTAAAMLEPTTTPSRQEIFPVTDDAQHLLGIVTTADLTVLADEADLEQVVCAVDIMRPPTALRRTDLLHAALDRMRSEGLRELPVVDAERRVLGMIDEAAIAHAYLEVRARQRAQAARAASDASSDRGEDERGPDETTRDDA